MSEGTGNPPRHKGSISARLDGEVALAGYGDLVLVARGGDGVVYRARQDGLGRDVAVKVMHLDDPAAIGRFQRELEITVRLGRQHPNIVTVHDTGVLDSGEPCLVMEYYDRGSLHDQLRENGPSPVAEVIAVGAVMADALAFAHDQGVLHRDVKPQNILVLPTSYVLADFGIARRVDAEHSASLELFSYRHASPQVLDGEAPTAADDLYSLGSTLYTLLDGRAPFAAQGADSDTPLAYLRRARTAAPRPLSRDDVPAALVEIIDRCLAKGRADRFADAHDLKRALAAVPTAQPTAQASVPTPVPPAADPWGPPPGWTPGEPRRTAPVPTPVVEPGPRPAAVPVATSALSHLDGLPEPVDLDDEATAAPPEQDPAPEQPAPPTPPAAPRRRRLLVLGAAAVAVGVVVGVGTALLRQEDPPAGTGADQTGPGIETYTGSLPAPTGDPQVAVGDPNLAPEITGLEDRSTSVVLRWDDPSDGEATFVVTRRTGDLAEPVAEVRPGTTQHTVEGLDPAESRYCFQVLALVDGGRGKGVSAERCTPTRG
ncbi:hypothetical protein BLA60_05935 [Actinophytocola xinjiangensis]|uniref:non-specific serine/threonine protein kinase n=1 Tax=Actinophytocola xinjiangensis TaxID=485602 RepID=A0A7Z0WPZ6_9PSEU|nr:protein kinase [Actinophytocola xinjiangensis]OLF12808.1 hypothetical protein BLA60_05935 [Actinophytocola xinjiangensis]